MVIYITHIHRKVFFFLNCIIVGEVTLRKWLIEAFFLHLQVLILGVVYIEERALLRRLEVQWCISQTGAWQHTGGSKTLKTSDFRAGFTSNLNHTYVSQCRSSEITI